MQLYTGTPLTNVTIENNIVEDNDLGFNDPTSPYAYCTPERGRGLWRGDPPA